MLSRILVALVVVVVLVVGSVAVASALSAGNVAPDFQGKTLEGKDFRLSDFKGEPIVLKIGTTWCPSCREQAKSLNLLHSYLSEKGIRFVDVYVDETEKSVSKFFSKEKYRKPSAVILDEGNAHKAYNVYVIPRLILIDSNFNVFRDGDALTSAILKKKLEKMLKKN
ncbi:MAG TPA: TlpA disulfide reductase family protein [Geopsychrobacteraceae bacterium]|nr:TlpA disulfide reductase family protein [Geopsychrobacteraceae bacterium]